MNPHRVNSITPLDDAVVVEEMNFDGRTLSSGLILVGDNGTTAGIRPRWGRVYAVGPEQTQVKVGDWVLVEHGRWTRGLNIEDSEGPKTIRRVDPKDMMMVSDSPDMPTDDTMSQAVQASQKTL